MFELMNPMLMELEETRRREEILRVIAEPTAEPARAQVAAWLHKTADRLAPGVSQPMGESG